MRNVKWDELEETPSPDFGIGVTAARHHKVRDTVSVIIVAIKRAHGALNVCGLGANYLACLGC